MGGVAAGRRRDRLGRSGGADRGELPAGGSADAGGEDSGVVRRGVLAQAG